MTEVLSFSNAMRARKFCLLGGCLILLVAGCSSKLQTTITSGTLSSSKPQVAASEPVELATEVVVPDEPIKEISQTAIPSKEMSRLDIPVEEPVRPVIRDSAPTEIFATPRTGVVDQGFSAPLGTPKMEESVAPSPSAIASTSSHMPPQESPSVLGIPPISFEPETPVRPTIRGDATPPEEMIARVEPEPVKPVPQAPKPEEPVQMAKVVPSSPETVEERAEDLFKTLGDVYFDYDRFSIRNDAVSVLRENAQTLVAGLSDNKIVIEGHCDQRGTESYNMVLGERRANAVKEYLVYLGVPDEKLQVVSYGKEK
ncbi:MAG: OmpA family protein, partial [Nitrospira sp.]|nr:OmpA family protein [Nitrospira sp.]